MKYTISQETPHASKPATLQSDRKLSKRIKSPEKTVGKTSHSKARAGHHRSKAGRALSTNRVKRYADDDCLSDHKKTRVHNEKENKHMVKVRRGSEPGCVLKSDPLNLGKSATNPDISCIDGNSVRQPLVKQDSLDQREESGMRCDDREA